MGEPYHYTGSAGVAVEEEEEEEEPHEQQQQQLLQWLKIFRLGKRIQHSAVWVSLERNLPKTKPTSSSQHGSWPYH